MSCNRAACRRRCCGGGTTAFCSASAASAGAGRANEGSRSGRNGARGVIGTSRAVFVAGSLGERAGAVFFLPIDAVQLQASLGRLAAKSPGIGTGVGHGGFLAVHLVVEGIQALVVVGGSGVGAFPVERVAPGRIHSGTKEFVAEPAGGPEAGTGCRRKAHSGQAQGKKRESKRYHAGKVCCGARKYR